MIIKLTILPFVILIKLYQFILSPMLGMNCRYIPTCSEYTVQSLKSFGLLKGFYLSIIRISKCHPWGGYGYDPLPSKTKKYNNE